MKQLIFIIYIALGVLTPSCTVLERDVDEEKKIVIYQVFTRLFGSDNPTPQFNGDLSVNGTGKFSDFTTTALDSIRAMGMTHIWYTGVIEHATTYTVDTIGGVQMNHPKMIKGKAGSPYAIKDYYDVNAYLANNVESRMAEFEMLVERSHSANLKVIIDFVPNHVARGYHSDVAPQGVEDFGEGDDNTKAFSADNNFYYIPGERLQPQFDTNHDIHTYEEYPARATGNDVFTSTPNINDWYETIKINYGVDYQDGKKPYFDSIPDTWLKMRDILLFWATKDIDGFRCDMAEMTPVEFWEWCIKEVKAQYPDIIFIAEIYNPDAYQTYITRGGFDYLYDKVGLYDTLKNIVKGKSPSSAISADRAKVAAVQSHMLNFLENHDEQRIAWHEFAGDAKAGIPMMLVSTLSDSIPMMIYFGQELGVESPEASGFSGADGRTTIFDFWSVPDFQAWRNGGKFDGAGLTAEQKSLRANYISILKLANKSPFTDGQFYDLTLNNPESNSNVYAFIRYTDSQVVIVVSNLSNENQSVGYSLPMEFDTTNLEVIFGDTGDYNNTNTDGISLNLKPYEGIILKL